MAIVSCPSCGQPISNEATACPHCGASMIHKKKKRGLILTIAFLLALSIVAVIFLFLEKRVDDRIVGIWESEEDFAYSRIVFSFTRKGTVEYYAFDAAGEKFQLVHFGRFQYSASKNTLSIQYNDTDMGSSDNPCIIDGDTMIFNQMRFFRVTDTSPLVPPSYTLVDIKDDMLDAIWGK